MINYDYLLLHYGELSTKGHNRQLFVQQLLRNLKHSLGIKYPTLEYEAKHEHLYLKLTPAIEISSLISDLGRISGIQRITPVLRSLSTLEGLKENALRLLVEKTGTFKVKVKRSNKSFPLSSYEVADELGGFILENNKNLTVDVHAPDFILNVEIRDDYSYLSDLSYPGLGGYPLGMNGKVLLLLSGGLDSPVAASLLLRRGLLIEALHFAAPPYTSSSVIEKLFDILKIFNNEQQVIRLHVAPFTELQLSIYEHCPESYCITIMRRMMMRIASEVAPQYGAEALATGEAVGQVASQTLSSMRVINEVTNYPVIRPLAVLDKIDIIKKAKEIGTYDISIRPFEDCCTIFTPKNPKTKPHLKECLYLEKKWDWETLLKKAVAEIKTYVIKGGEVSDEDDSTHSS